MKKFNSFFMAIAMVMTVTLIGCSKDDEPDANLWSGTLSEPKYEADAQAWKISNNSMISSIELTASGNYIVVRNGYYNDYAPARSDNRHGKMFRLAKKSRMSLDENIYGNFKKNPDGSFDLEGFGTLTIADAGRNLILDLDSGEELSLDATPLPKMESNELNDRFCRTWYLKKEILEIQDMSGNILREEVYVGEEELSEDFVMAIVVSKFGTFVQIDWDNTFEDHGTWEWANKKTQTFNYSFGYGDGGYEQVAFKDNKATFIEDYTDYDDETGRLVRFVERAICETK